jgi:hypothetical protein
VLWHCACIRRGRCRRLRGAHCGASTLQARKVRRHGGSRFVCLCGAWWPWPWLLWTAAAGPGWCAGRTTARLCHLPWLRSHGARVQCMQTRGACLDWRVGERVTGTHNMAHCPPYPRQHDRNASSHDARPSTGPPVDGSMAPAQRGGRMATRKRACAAPLAS